MADSQNTDLSPTDADLVISAPKRKALTVDLVGQRYSVEMPKGALLISLVRSAKTVEGDADAVMTLVMKFVTMAFGKKESKVIERRMNDADDDLDLWHIVQLMEAMIEKTAKNPTM